MTLGFEKTNRLLKRREFQRAFDQGTKCVSSGLVLFAMANNSEKPRLGLVVSKKYGKAVERNRFKRMLRESFRQLQLLYPGLDVVVIARKPAARLNQPAIQVELERNLSRLVKRIQAS